MKKIYIKYALAGFALLWAVVSTAQVNSVYFMNNVTTRHELNPAFQPDPGGYFGFPGLSSVYLGFGNNSFGLKDVLIPQNGQLKWFPDTDKGVYDFLNKVKSNTRTYTEVNVDLLSLGFRVNNSYFTFGLTEKITGNVYVPKGMFDVLKGAPDVEGNNLFSFDHLSMNANLYLEYALGYSLVLNDRLNVGAKAKFLSGQGNVSLNRNNKIRLDISREIWTLDLDADADITFPFGTITTKDGGKYKDIESNFSAGDFLKPQGTGFALDLGASYKLLDNRLTLSASVLDLGFIKWKGNYKAVADSKNQFEGLGIDPDGNINYDDFFNALADSIRYSITPGNHSYNTSLASKILVGAEYAVLNNKVSLGLLSKNIFIDKMMLPEVTTSVNYRPADVFNASLNYSWFNGQFGSVGLGLGTRLGSVNLYVAGDYMPFKYAKGAPIPVNTRTYNVQFGLVFNFGYTKDDDHDGVKNKKDRCLYTPVGVIVDQYGCPLDSDGDGVPDYMDKCPNTPAGVAVDEFGCPIDSDGDGVPDYLDKCPNTPAGVEVDENGCPIDSDSDGVPDYLDKCPGTPPEAHGFVDANGCPIDTDGDGVPDYLDKCPGTPPEAYEFVDANGCPIDTDGDGIPDYLDKCLTLPGTKENNGCPVVKEEVKEIFEKALQGGIEFETGKDVIKKISFPLLDQITTILKENPAYMLTINGHTDNVGKPKSNLLLSEKRANAVRNYLIKGGIDPFRITAKGYGDTQPLVPNTTKANKAQNRRVEFIVKFEKTEEAK